ncbi:hypothetical protein DL95DRAFT_467444 [Leptodontidium sp. 2 PMI_412]|nr:hypothetical protein DL95DRAFT_467444 [Leptodontidium sp. 2 PMI_412]
MPAANKDLVFVHLNEVTGPVQDIDTRNKVRAHVMRDFQRKRHHKPKASKSNKRSLLPTLKTDLIEVDTQKRQSLSPVYLGTSSDDDPEASITMMRLLDPQFLGELELFNTLPIASSPRLQLLIHYYNEVLVNRLIPVDPKNKWFNYAITDPALFHGIMLHTAMHHRLVHGENDEAEQLQFKGNTIKMVEGRLEDPVLSRSDDTIGAVKKYSQQVTLV